MAGTVHVSHHQFFLLDRGTCPEDGGMLYWRDNGLVTTDPHRVDQPRGGAVPQCPTRRSGEFGGHRRTRDLPIRRAELRVAGLMLDPAPEFRIPFPIGSVVCRVRVHATGRDTDIDGTIMEPVENYLIEIWDSATESPADVARVSSGYGAALRRPRPGRGV